MKLIHQLEAVDNVFQLAMLTDNIEKVREIVVTDMLFDPPRQLKYQSRG